MSDSVTHPTPSGTPAVSEPTATNGQGAEAAPASTPASADSLVDLLDQLILPGEPAPISMAPETAGWWVLGALLLVGAGALARGLIRRHRAGAYRRAALAALAQAGDDPALIADILRRTALAAWPRARVAGLTGADWVAFLQRTGPFPAERAKALTQAPYAPARGRDPALSQAARDWVRHHKVQGA